MAKHGPRLLALAREHGVDLLYEASVGGGIPIIAPLKRDLLANRIRALSAIINGTTNYILTAMSRDGADFGDALKRGAGPRLRRARPDERHRGRGRALQAGDPREPRLPTPASAPKTSTARASRSSTAKDFRYAAELGYTIKLLALAAGDDSGIQARVHPAFISADAPLAKVDGVLNAVQVEGDLTGRGATSRAAAPAASRRPARSSPTCWTPPRASSAAAARRTSAERRRDADRADERAADALLHPPHRRRPARRAGPDRAVPRRGADQHRLRHPEGDALDAGRPSWLS